MNDMNLGHLGDITALASYLNENCHSNITSACIRIHTHIMSLLYALVESVKNNKRPSHC